MIILYLSTNRICSKPRRLNCVIVIGDSLIEEHFKITHVLQASFGYTDTYRCNNFQLIAQKKEKGGMANAKMYTFLEQNIAARHVD